MLVSLLKKTGLKLSLNDPRWGNRKDDGKKAQEGKKPGEGPPDLDQLWRDFNQRLNAFFGQKNRPDNGGNNGGGGGPRPDMKGAGITAGVVGVIAVFIWLASGAFIVQEGQSGVVLTFGQVHAHGAGRFQLALAVPVPDRRNRQRVAGAHGGSRLSPRRCATSRPASR